MQNAGPFVGTNGSGARCGEKSRERASPSQDVAPRGAFFCAKFGAEKVERLFYFQVFGRKNEHFKEKRLFSVEKKSLLFRRYFRILNSIGGEKWVIEADKWSFPPLHPIKGGKGAAPHGKAAGQIQ